MAFTFQIPNQISVNHNYSDYDIMKNSVNHLRGNEGNLKSYGNEVVTDTRTKHCFSIGKWKTENQEIYRSTLDLASRLKSAMITKFGTQTGLRLFNAHIKTRSDGSKSISARSVKDLFASAQAEEIQLKKAMLGIKSSEFMSNKVNLVFTKAGVDVQLANHILARAQTLRTPVFHDYESLATRKFDLENSIKEVTNLRDRLKSIKVDENLQEKHNEIIKSLTASLKDFNTMLSSVTQELKDHPMKKKMSLLEQMKSLMPAKRSCKILKASI